MEITQTIPTIGKFLGAAGYRVVGGSKYLWTCYGPNAWAMDVELDSTGTANAGIVFDTVSRVVYEVDVDEDGWVQAKRWVNPRYHERLTQEYKQRGVDPRQTINGGSMYDDSMSWEAIIELIECYRGSQSESTTLQLSVDDDVTDALFQLAHREDVTLNELVLSILTEVIDPPAM